MKTILRTLAAVVVGMGVLILLLIGVELFSAVVHPLPEGFGGTEAEMCEHVARYPQWVLAVSVPMWAFAAFASIWTARKIGNAPAAATVGLLVLAALIFNISMLPYPLWFKIISPIVVPLAILAGWPWKRSQAAVR